MKTACWLLAFITLATALPGQSLPHRRYTTSDGLIADRITVITQDNDGFMWMGSLFGLSRYDGNRFTTIQLPASQQYRYVTSLLAVDHKIYAGFLFSGGLMEYEKGRTTAYQIPSSNNDIAALFETTRGILAVNTTNEVYRFHNKQFQLLFTHPESINTICEQSNSFWVGTANGIHIYENGKSTRSLLPNSAVLSMRKTAKGILVVSTEKNISSFRLFTSADAFTTIWQTSNLQHIPFYSNNAEQFWGIDTKHELINLASSSQPMLYDAKFSASSEMKYLFADRENNLWIATDPGILKISNIPATSYAFDELAPGGGDICQGTDSTIWCTNSKYLYFVKNNQLVKAEEFRDAAHNSYIGALITDQQNNLWVSSWNNGIWKLTCNDGKLVSKKFMSNYKGQSINVNCMARDNQGNTWAAGDNGIFHIRDGEIIDHFIFHDENQQRSFITAITVDPVHQFIWVGKNATGLLKIAYKEVNGNFIYEVQEQLDERNGLTDPFIRSLIFDSRNELWIGTRLGGIFRLQSNNGHHSIKHYGSANGINCTRVTDIAEEKGKAIWFATCNGIFRFAFANEQLQQYSVNDGLLGSEIFSLALDHRQNNIWAVSGQGVTSLRYAGTERKPAPQVNIIQVAILGQEDTTALFSNSSKELSSSQNSISFVFAGTSYANEKKTRYKYMLEGYDRNWSQPVQNNNVNYASLPFGEYTFKVIASNGDQWSEHPATFSFHIVRPFYKSGWFIALVAIALALTYYFIRMYRLQQKLKMEKLRVNIARDLHDDIGSALGSINLLSENARRRLTTTMPAEEIAGVFQKIGYSAQSMLDSMDDIIWTINPEKDSLDDLLIRMREFAIPLLEAKDMMFDVDLQATDEVKPSMETKRNIYLVFKEAIFNIVRHSGATQVSVKGWFSNRNFEIVISDNGKGFDTNVQSGRNGLRNMKKRAALSGGALQISSVAGKGTTVKFSGPFR